MIPLETPVVLVIFAREKTTRLVIERIRQVQPRKLYIIADGPRKSVEGERALCERVRAVALDVDWECEVKTNFSEHNMGIRHRLPTGLDWVFSMEERAIIVEDDCLPEPSFFAFCEQLLERYEHDPRVMSVSGFCPMEPDDNAPFSYRAQELFVVWGWATWKSAWAKYLPSKSAWDHHTRVLPAAVASAPDKRLVSGLYDEVVGPNDWSLKWLMSMWLEHGIQLSPTVNLVKSIGFLPDATNVSVDPFLGLSGRSTGTTLPLRHPPTLTIDLAADRAVLDCMNRQLDVDRCGRTARPTRLIRRAKQAIRSLHRAA